MFGRKTNLPHLSSQEAAAGKVARFDAEKDSLFSGLFQNPPAAVDEWVKKRSSCCTDHPERLRSVQHYTTHPNGMVHVSHVWYHLTQNKDPQIG